MMTTMMMMGSSVEYLSKMGVEVTRNNGIALTSYILPVIWLL